jgi:hypothetical protein
MSEHNPIEMFPCKLDADPDGKCIVCGRAGGKAQPPDTCGQCRYYSPRNTQCHLEPEGVRRFDDSVACRHGVRK